MKLGVFQGPLAPGGGTDRLAVLDGIAGRAAAEQIDLLILPELFLTGYNIGAEALRARAEPEDGKANQAAASIARKHGVALLYGYPERAVDGKLFNSALLVAPDGARQANFRKLHLFGDMEQNVFTPGTDPAVLAEIDGVKLGILICYDVEFPELVRGLALRGVDLVAVPTAQMQPYEFVPRKLVPTRAYENSVFLAYANHCGREAELIYTGESCIIGPDGSDLARAGTEESLISATLSPKLLAKARALNSFISDRRPTLYASLTEAAAP
jgi:predicted amidohydrolase